MAAVTLTVALAVHVAGISIMGNFFLRNLGDINFGVQCTVILYQHQTLHFFQPEVNSFISLNDKTCIKVHCHDAQLCVSYSK